MVEGRIELERRIDSIVVGVRHRQDLGDIEALMQSIERVGLLQPITITPDGVLVCGARRLEAMRRLGERTLKVWVRSGISDDLSQLLSQQDENALHKPLSPLEAESLFREVKQLLAEDARRRQAATQFGNADPAPASDERGVIGGENGAGGRAAPRGQGDSRSQAAKLITGTDSHKRFEQIGWLKRLAEDSLQPPHLRGLASAALEDIENGAAVEPAYKKVRASIELTNTTPGQPAPVTQEELDRLAAEALERVRQEQARKGVRNLQRKRKVPTYRSVRSFILTWTELDGWTELYDAEQLARELKDAEWERFERVIADSIAFAERVREARASLSATA